MKFLVGPGATMPRRDSPAVQANKNLMETCIARTAFRRQPPDIQLEYAQYHELPDGEMSTDTSTGLFRESNWTSVQNIMGRIRLPTASGVVPIDVMDLIDLLAEEQTDSSSLGDTRVRTPEDTYLGTHGEEEDDIQEDPSVLQHDFQDDLNQVERFSPDDLHRIADELEKAHTFVKAAVEESRTVTRDAIADILILQGLLAEANSYHAEVVETITSVIGMGPVQGIMEQLDAATRDGRISYNIYQDTVQMETTRGRTSIGEATDRTQTAIPAPYRVMPDVNSSPDGHRVACPSNKRAHENTRSRSKRVDLKHTYDNSYDADKVKTPSFSSTSFKSHGFLRRHKKKRVGESSQTGDPISIANEFSAAETTLINYASDNNNGNDSSTERNFIGDQREFRDFRGESSDDVQWSSDESEQFKRLSDDVRWSCSDDEDSYSNTDNNPMD